LSVISTSCRRFRLPVLGVSDRNRARTFLLIALANGADMQRIPDGAVIGRTQLGRCAVAERLAVATLAVVPHVDASAAEDA